MFKLCIFGDGGVGKTTLVKRYLSGVFSGDTTMTIGVDFHIKKLQIEGLEVGLQIWDFAGEERFRFLLPQYVFGSSGGIFLYDITRFSSLQNLTEWMTIFDGTVKRAQFQIPVIMAGGKLDLEEKRSVLKEDAIKLAKNYNFLNYIECSAKTGYNIEQIFIEITTAMLKNSVLLE